MNTAAKNEKLIGIERGVTHELSIVHICDIELTAVAPQLRVSPWPFKRGMVWRRRFEQELAS